MPNTTVTADFSSTAAAAGIGLRIVQEAGITIGSAERTLRLYPSVNAKVATDVGTVTKGPDHEEFVEREAVTFRGTNVGSTEFPIERLVEVREFGATLDEDGDPINVSFVVDNFQLRASQPIFGGVSISYVTSYKELAYVGEVVSEATPLGGAAVVRLGSVFAFFQGQVASFDVQPTDFEEDEFREFYKVVSTAVVNADGRFETPPDYTVRNPTTWPGISPPTPDPNIDARLVERVHESGRINSRNSVSVRTFFVAVERPFLSFYRPPLDIKIARPGQNGLTSEQLNSTAALEALQSVEERIRRGIL